MYYEKLLLNIPKKTAAPKPKAGKPTTEEMVPPSFCIIKIPELLFWPDSSGCQPTSTEIKQVCWSKHVLDSWIEDNPEDCIRRETEEETGYKVKEVRKVFEAYMSPGSVTEILYFFIAEYSKDMKVAEGGGLEEEEENIEVLETDIDKAIDMIATGEIKDAKTIMLLQYIKLHQIL